LTVLNYIFYDSIQHNGDVSLDSFTRMYDCFEVYGLNVAPHVR